MSKPLVLLLQRHSEEPEDKLIHIALETKLKRTTYKFFY